MWWYRLCIVVFCLYSYTAFASTTSSQLIQTISVCINNIAKGKDTVYRDDPVNLKKVCPLLAAQLAHPDLKHTAPILEPVTSFGQLTDIKASLNSYRHRGASHAKKLKTTHLDNILAQINRDEAGKEKKEEEPSLWHRFWKWFFETLEEYFSKDDGINLEMDPDDREIIQNLTAAIIVAIILYIIIMELRAARITGFFRRRKLQKTAAKQSKHSQEHGPLTLKEIASLPLNQQIPALLRYAIALLIKKNVLPDRENLTNQELLRIVAQKQKDNARAFADLVNTADLAVYGKRAFEAADVSSLYDRVNKLEQSGRSQQ